jgi:hypothetical protein
MALAIPVSRHCFPVQRFHQLPGLNLELLMMTP